MALFVSSIEATLEPPLGQVSNFIMKEEPAHFWPKLSAGLIIVVEELHDFGDGLVERLRPFPMFTVLDGCVKSQPCFLHLGTGVVFALATF